MEEKGNSSPTEEIIKTCEEAGSWPRLWPKIEDPRECLFTARQLASLRNQYETENDPLALLEAISLSYREFFCVPTWAHTALAEASQKYLVDHGEVDFDDLIKLKVQRKGPANSAFKRRIKQWQYREAAFEVWLLHKGLGFTLPVSCLIASKLSHSYVYRGKEIPVNFSAAHIKDIYSSADYGFKKEYPCEEWFGDDPGDHLEWYVEHYEDAFQSLVNNGEFWQKGLLKSAKRVRQRLFDKATKRLETLSK